MSEEEVKKIDDQIALDQKTINEDPILSQLAGENSEWKITLLEKKVFPGEIQSVSDLVYSFSVKKDSKSGKLKFLELIQKNVRKKDKNIKSLVSETSKLEDISERYLEEIDKIHQETFEFHSDKAKKVPVEIDENLLR